MSKLKEAMEALGKETVGQLVYELIRADKKASGDLINSVDYNVLETTNGVVLEILANDYLTYVDKGRRPNRKMPPVKKIEEWIKQRGLQGRDKKGRFIKRKSFAFAIAKSIAKNGIKPTNVLKKTRQNLLKNVALIAPAMKEEIEEAINKILEGL